MIRLKAAVLYDKRPARWARQVRKVTVVVLD